MSGNQVTEVSQIKGVQDTDIFILTKGSGALELYTRNLADGGNVKRLELTGQVDTAIWQFQNSTITGIVLSGDIAGGAQDLLNINALEGRIDALLRIESKRTAGTTGIELFTDNGAGVGVTRIVIERGAVGGSGQIDIHDPVDFKTHSLTNMKLGNQMNLNAQNVIGFNAITGRTDAFGNVILRGGGSGGSGNDLDMETWNGVATYNIHNIVSMAI